MTHHTTPAKDSPAIEALEITCGSADRFGKCEVIAKADGKVIHRDVIDWRSQHHRTRFAGQALAKVGGASRVPTDSDLANWSPEGEVAQPDLSPIENAILEAGERAANAAPGKRSPVELLDQPPPHNAEAEREQEESVYLEATRKATAELLKGIGQ